MYTGHHCVLIDYSRPFIHFNTSSLLDKGTRVSLTRGLEPPCQGLPFSTSLTRGRKIILVNAMRKLIMSFAISLFPSLSPWCPWSLSLSPSPLPSWVPLCTVSLHGSVTCTCPCWTACTSTTRRSSPVASCSVRTTVPTRPSSSRCPAPGACFLNSTFNLLTQTTLKGDLYHQVWVWLTVTSCFENVPLLTSQVGMST